MANSNSQEHYYNLSGIRILILEDFEYMADLMVSMLRKFQVQKIHATCDVKQAQTIVLEQCRSETANNLDLVITDLLPPKQKGLDFLDWLRKHEHEAVRFLPVVFCSTDSRMNVVIKGRDSGASEILVKPISAQKLAHRLHYIIERPRPFIKCASFSGPDRRRKTEKITIEERRLRTLDNIKVTHEAA